MRPVVMSDEEFRCCVWSTQIWFTGKCDSSQGSTTGKWVKYPLPSKHQTRLEIQAEGPGKTWSQSRCLIPWMRMSVLAVCDRGVEASRLNTIFWMHRIFVLRSEYEQILRAETDTIFVVIMAIWSSIPFIFQGKGSKITFVLLTGCLAHTRTWAKPARKLKAPASGQSLWFLHRNIEGLCSR